MPGINEMLAALFGRVPQNATQGGVPADQGQFRPQNAPLGPLNSSAVPGRSYASGSPRGESAGYTTSSPGWRQDQVPTVPPPTATTGAIGPGAPTPFPRPDPVVTGATGAAAPHGGPTPEMIANATTTPSALFQPLPSRLDPANATTSPSALWQPLPQPGAHGQPPAPQSVFNPASMGQPPAPQGVVDLPALGSPPAPQSVVTPPTTVRHPPNPETGKMTASDERFGGDKTASTKKPSTKKGNRLKSQYSLMKDRRSNR
jgi:hypothetical protein